MARQRMDGVLDWFRKKPSQLPALIPGSEGSIIYVDPKGTASSRLPSAPTPESSSKKKEDFFSIFLPPEKDLAPLREKLTSFIPTEGPTFMAPYVEAAKEMFEFVEPSPEPGPKKEDLFAGMFDPSSEEEGSLFDAFDTHVEAAEEVIKEARERAPHEDWPTGEPPIYGITKWKPPTAFEVAHWIQTSDQWNLNDLFEFVLQNTDYPGWKRDVENSAHTREPAELEIDQIAHWSNAYEELANFLDIPQGVVDIYFGNIHNEEQGMEATELFNKEVLAPYLENISKALDALRPPSLRGWFEISPADDYSWWLKYVEAKFPQGG